MGKQLNSFDDAFSSGFLDVYSVATIVLSGASNVPPGDAMGCPSVENNRGLKHEDLCARRSKGCAIEIKGSIELGFSR